MGEFPFADRIAQLAGLPPHSVLQGIADDCAVLDVGGADHLLVATDAMVHHRHFDLRWMSPLEVGGRAVSSALSDIAAMGGRPLATLCSVAFPAATHADDAVALMRGVADAARAWSAPLIGGDTVSAPHDIMVDIVVLGWAPAPWLRSGARRGDKILVTGALGAASVALGLAQRDPERLSTPPLQALRNRLVAPTPRLREAAVLARTGLVHAGMDISDGLYQDAGHMARRSGVRIELDVRRLPVLELARDVAHALGGMPLWWPATGGEDFELLLTADRDDVPALQDALASEGLAPLTVVGDVVGGAGVVLIGPSGSELELERGGWDQFRGAG